MTDLSSKVALVYDHGLFFPIAQRLAKNGFGRVLYHTHWEKGFPTVNDCVPGDGFGDVERCDDIFSVLDEVDCWVFPDVFNSGLQRHLEGLGKRVWGSRSGDDLEINREKFNRVLLEVGLPVAKHETIKGLTNLRLFLRDKTDRYIKISRFRGTMETTHWRDYDLDSLWLDRMAVKLGPAQDLLKFLVFEPIDAPVEIGGDTYCVDGQWPNLMLHGDEAKDKAYMAAVTQFEDMPDVLVDVMEAFSPVLKKERYRNQWSMETRDGRFIDATCRGGLPSTASQLNTWTNFPEIVWHGANGELVQPQHEHDFSAECIVNLKSGKEDWGKIRLPAELEGHAQLSGCCEIDGARCWPPDDEDDNDVGWLVAGADSMEAVLEEMKRLEKLLPEGLSIDLHPMADLLEQIKAGEKEGVQFSEDTVPAPEIVLEK